MIKVRYFKIKFSFLIYNYEKITEINKNLIFFKMKKTEEEQISSG